MPNYRSAYIRVFIQERVFIQKNVVCIKVKPETNIKLQKSVKHPLKILSSIYKIWPKIFLTCQNVNSEFFTSNYCISLILYKQINCLLIINTKETHRK